MKSQNLLRLQHSFEDVFLAALKCHES